MPCETTLGGNSRRNTQENGWRSDGPAGAGGGGGAVVRTPSGGGRRLRYLSCRERGEGRAQAVRVDGWDLAGRGGAFWA